MQRLAIDLLRPEMISAIDVADHGGRILIRGGASFQETHIRAVVQAGFGSVYVELPGFTAAVPPGLLSQELQANAVQLIQQVYETFRDKGAADGGPVRDLASRLVNEVVLRRGGLFQFVDLRTQDGYLPAHAVNVAAMSIMIGLKMELIPARLQELALGALMLDLGEMLLPPEILRKAEKLTPEEMDIVKKHPEHGFSGLRRKISGIPAPSAHVSYQHHESFDGNGYPRGISGHDIHEYARIVAVADMFDALVSDRPFRRYYLPHEAAGILRAFTGRFLDPAMVPLLLSNIAVYPQGSVVRIDTGEIGEVAEVNTLDPTRPKVKLLTDKWGKKSKAPELIDMEKQKSRYVEKVLKDQEIMDWVTS